MRTILKVLYVAFGIVIAFVVAMASYNVSAYDHIVELTNEGIKSKEYYKVAMVHGGVLDKDNLIAEQNSKLDMAIYPSFTLSSYSYTENDEAIKYEHYDKSYYIYLFDLKFDTGLSDVEVNKSALRFETSSGKYFDYLFVVNNDTNSSSYVKNPSSLKEAVINSERNAFERYDAWGFIGITLTETIYEAISNELNNEPISKISVIGNDGDNNVVASYDVDLSFDNQELYDRAQPLLDIYNAIYASDDALKAMLEKGLETYYNGFEVELTNTNGTFYGEKNIEYKFDGVVKTELYSSYEVNLTNNIVSINGVEATVLENTDNGVKVLIDNIVYELISENGTYKLRVAGFEESFLYGSDNTNFTFRYSNEKLQPNSLIWDAAGVVALFVLAAGILYFLIFHFKFIKRLVLREGKKGNNKYTVNKEAVEARTKAKKSNVKMVSSNPLTRNEEVKQISDKPITAKEVVEANKANENVVDAEIVEENNK